LLGQHTVKQLLLGDAYSDIAQKHRFSRFSFTTDHRGEWNRNDGEAEMVDVAFACSSKIREQAAGKRENKVHSLRRGARLLRLLRRACIVVAEWHSQARQRETLARLNDHVLADVGFMRERQEVNYSKLFCWLP
jgi:uncharacterized protein YjiS (DUF1127 family)